MILHDLSQAKDAKTKLQLIKEYPDKTLFVYAYDKDKMFGIKFNDSQVDTTTLRDLTLGCVTLLEQLLTKELVGIST